MPPQGSTEPSGPPTFAEECSGGIGPEWGPMFGPGDPGYGLDSDFMGDLRQVSVANDICTIAAARLATGSGRPYASAAMTTKGRFSMRFGTLELRARYSGGPGVWPAFWLLPEDGTTSVPEIDVFEAYPGKLGLGGRDGPNVVVSTIHFEGGSEYFVYDHGSDMTADFHVYRMTWSQGLLVFSVDGIESGRIITGVPDSPMSPILSLAIGGPGYRANDKTPAVATMEIDYLRIWAT